VPPPEREQPELHLDHVLAGDIAITEGVGGVQLLLERAERLAA
jgi:hypothetical protein